MKIKWRKYETGRWHLVVGAQQVAEVEEITRSFCEATVTGFGEPVTETFLQGRRDAKRYCERVVRDRLQGVVAQWQNVVAKLCD